MVFKRWGLRDITQAEVRGPNTVKRARCPVSELRITARAELPFPHFLDPRHPLFD
jgi:hypothetical protein